MSRVGQRFKGTSQNHRCIPIKTNIYTSIKSTTATQCPAINQMHSNGMFPDHNELKWQRNTVTANKECVILFPKSDKEQITFKEMLLALKHRKKIVVPANELSQPIYDSWRNEITRSLRNANANGNEQQLRFCFFLCFVLYF